MAKIAQAGKIKLGASPNQPGLAELNLQQEWEGFNMDLAEYLAGTLGIEADNIEWVQTTAANRIPFIEQGKIDMFVTALAMTPEREETVNISGPYLKTSPQLIVRKGDAEKMQTLEEIPKGTKVCVLQGSQGQPRVAEEIPQAEIVEFNVLTNCIRALEQGTADAVDSTAPLLAGFVEEKPDVFEFTPIKYGEEERWGIGMSKDRSDLCEYLNEKLNEAFDDGSIVKMWDEHMGKSGLEAPAKPEEMTGC
ncbi:glutamate transport system substrate-binding protein [Arthrobacter sp. JUb119]|uniref:transporter substrate-binding domain-containing protein n=1 Tax=Arthrobacter sp. JUb115 TaxID=2485108 RepID=UPI0010D5C664|nr:transporter substrate-binding domain-containing protein [Arthrobacter sp. JUb115]MCS3494518.1 glutamate transport system substrate-binding protein [Arthrobacter sp. JUb119]TDU22608.1 amino acid ABC transporter substrate-binding protein (PAAT family) [Arthrobacter sp. JUb115]